MQKNRLWGSQEIELATGGTWINPPARGWVASGVSYRLKDIKKGDLVIAVGPDGWHYSKTDTCKDIPALFNAGSSAVVSAYIPDNLLPDQSVLKVDETLAAFQGLARYSRDRFQGKAICVTGSAGKTSTMKALHHVLSRQAPTWASSRCTNNRFGVMEGLARTPSGHSYGLYEFGLFRPGDVKHMSMITRPHVAVITTIHAAHLSNFQSVAHIAESKAEIFSGMNNDGIVVLNCDDPYFSRLCRQAQKLGIKHIRSFGKNIRADVCLISSKSDEWGSHVEVKVRRRRFVFYIPFAGTHWISNMLAVLCVVDAVGGDLTQALWDLEDFKLPGGRGARYTVAFKGKSFEILDDSYNATVVSMRNGLDILGMTQPSQGGHRIAVLGDIAHLGDATIALHVELAEYIKAAKVDRLFTVGEGMRHLRQAVPPHVRAFHGETARQLIHPIWDELNPGDVVLVKGSFPSRVSEIVRALRSGQ